MTLRSPATEAKYQKAKKSIRFMRTAPSLKEYKEWRVIENEYPYDKIEDKNIVVHHLLIPKRQVLRPIYLNEYEMAELEGLIEHVLPKNYTTIMMHFPKQQSIKNWLHYHLLVLK